MDLHDVQGLVFHAYRSFPFAAYILVKFRPNAAPAIRAWLAQLLERGQIDAAKPDEGPRRFPNVRVNLAFSASGLEALEFPEEDRQTFSSTFLDGLGRKWSDPQQPDHRSRIL